MSTSSLMCMCAFSAAVAMMFESLCLPQGSTVIQLFPYGWQKPGNGEVLREALYSNMVAATNCSYHRWVNTHREKAFLRKCVHVMMSMLTPSLCV